MSQKTLALTLWCTLLASACGGSELELEVATDASDSTEQGLAMKSPGDHLVIWQQNIEAMKAAAVRPSRLTAAMLTHPYRPDIVVLQEAWQKVLCGDYTNPAAPGDRELNNWQGSLADQRGLAHTCRGGAPALPGSVLYRLGTTLWGSVDNLEHRRPFDDAAGSTSRSGVTVVWDRNRFVLEDDFSYDDADVPGCSTVLREYQRVAVLLRDTRRTAGTADDRLVAVASVHYGSACPGLANQYVAEQMVRRWSTFGGRPLSLRVIAGDFNARVDDTSQAYADQRREAQQASWYRAFTAGSSWRGGHFLDAARARHGGGSGDQAPICGQWTYPNVQACAGLARCSSTCPGFGIGGRLERIDYTFVAEGQGPLSPSRVTQAETDDGSAGYSDHKGSYTVLSWQ